MVICGDMMAGIRLANEPSKQTCQSYIAIIKTVRIWNYPEYNRVQKW